ncbi:MAG: hypothetical protein HQ513_10840 [Rhodospirillales bacterium]|nr:hypothetical protein [Rhodospirillales bacterium]
MTNSKSKMDVTELKLAAEAAQKAYNKQYGTKGENDVVSEKNKLNGHTDPMPFVDIDAGFAAFAQRKTKKPGEVTINIRGSDELKDWVNNFGLQRAWAELGKFDDLANFAAEEMRKGSHVRAIGHSA